MWAKYALYEALTSIPEYDSACPPNKNITMAYDNAQLHMYV